MTVSNANWKILREKKRKEGKEEIRKENVGERREKRERERETRWPLRINKSTFSLGAVFRTWPPIFPF